MPEELKPCPFCGNSAMMFPPTCNRDTPYNAADRAHPIVRCMHCAAQVNGNNWDQRGKSAIEFWNTRRAPAPAPADDSPAVGPEWQRTRVAFAALTDAIAHLMTGRRLDANARQKFADCDAAVNEMKAACEAYRDAMGACVPIDIALKMETALKMVGCSRDKVPEIVWLEANGALADFQGWNEKRLHQ